MRILIISPIEAESWREVYPTEELIFLPLELGNSRRGYDQRQTVEDWVFEEEPDLVIADICMGCRNEGLKLVAAIQPIVPIVVLGLCIDKNDERTASKIGVPIFEKVPRPGINQLLSSVGLN